MFRMITAWQPPVIIQSGVYVQPKLFLNCICSTEIGPKQRRLVSPPGFHVKNQIEEVLQRCIHTNQYVCISCFTKLNRLSKIDFHFEYKQESLRA